MSAPNVRPNLHGAPYVGETPDGHATPENLHFKAQDELLNMIDSLRFEGLDKDVSLPQLVVCGDQSSGKSSVLEAIAEIPFPRKENLCTRFATEIVLRHKQVASMTVNIIPDTSRPTEEQAVLSSHKITIHHTRELPGVIEHATKLMGLDDTAKGKGAFAKDILRVEIEGPDQPHLTLVDLPGLIHSENKVQTAVDVDVIGKLVEKYIANPRTIILPVISAKNDYANQIILKKTREADPEGRRTLGIITKPDDLYPGSDNEKAFINLAKNGDISFALGWHVLRNRNAQEMESSFLEREQKEQQFFATTDWSQLPDDQLGITGLRFRLSDLLYHHIKQELPGLRKELDAIYTRTEGQLAKLGESRASIQQQRQYLTGLSIKFHGLTRSAASGIYDHEYFNSSQVRSYTVLENPNRLCAVVASCGLDFADLMNKHGHKYSFNTPMAFGASKNATIRSVKVGGEDVAIDQIGLDSSQSMALVKRVLANNRGTELPGSFNPRLIGELYQIQSQNWGKLAVHHIAHIASVCESFCNGLRNHLAPCRTSNGYLDNVIEEALARRVDAAKKELTKILDDEKCPPLTFNHYYTLTIQKSRIVKRKRASAETEGSNGTPSDKRAKTGTPAAQFGSGGILGSGGRSDGAVTVQNGNPNKIPVAVENDKGDITFEEWEAESDTRMILMDMDEHSCRDALEALQSYYKVARKTFIDNIEKQVIRRHLVNGLENIFSPAVVAGWTDDEIAMAAAEPKAVTTKRQDLEERLRRIRKGVEVFKQAERMTV